MVRYRFRYTSQLLPVLNQANVFHTPQSFFFEIHFIVIILSRPRSSKWYFFYVSYKIPACTCRLIQAHHMPLCSHPRWSDRPNNIWWGT